jgi:hypothetical protein
LPLSHILGVVAKTAIYHMTLLIKNDIKKQNKKKEKLEGYECREFLLVSFVG